MKKMIERLSNMLRRRLCKRGTITYENGRWHVANIHFKGCGLAEENGCLYLRHYDAPNKKDPA